MKEVRRCGQKSRQWSQKGREREKCRSRGEGIKKTGECKVIQVNSKDLSSPVLNQVP